MVNKKKRKSNKWNYLLALLGFILIGTGSWAIYSLINQGAGDVLKLIGIQNVYLQLLAVIVLVFLGLLFSGVGIIKAVSRLVKG